MNRGHILSEAIIKACDIRGIVDEHLCPTDALFIGRAFGSYLRDHHQDSCIVGRDGRLSSPELAAQLITGLLESGIDVSDIGLVPVGMLYFALGHLKQSAAVMVTASHNPPEYNGFKFVSDGQPFHGDQIRVLERISREGALHRGRGRCENRSITGNYLDYLCSYYTGDSRSTLKIVWDPGNGAAASVIRLFTDRLPGEHVLICDEVDGSFPYHHPDPSREANMAMLRSAVLDHGADLGIAFDGDGDRLGVMDAEGRLFYGDQLLVLLARGILEQEPGAVIMGEIKSSRFFIDEIRRLGGAPFLWKTGHTYQKEMMRERSIPLGGETSGHFYFRENNNYDDAFFTAVKLLQELRIRPDALRELGCRIPDYYDSSEIRIPLKGIDPGPLLLGIKNSLSEAGSAYSEIDGIRCDYERGFWILRASNTHPHLTFRCEHETRESFDESVKMVRQLLHAAGLKNAIDTSND